MQDLNVSVSYECPFEGKPATVTKEKLNLYIDIGSGDGAVLEVEDCPACGNGHDLLEQE